MTDSDTYCPSPWHGGFFTQSEQSVCCAYPPTANDSIATYLQGPEVQAVKTALSSGEIPPGCQRCFDIESQGGKSIRQIFRRTYAESGIEFQRDPARPSRPQMIELRLGNLCNFRCRMCYPKWSSSIALEVAERPHLRGYFTVNEMGQGRESGSDQFLQEIIAMIPQLRWINFTGGEPMIIPELITVMDAMVDQGHSENITIQVTTNCSTVNPRITDRFSRFQRVLLTLSLDATRDAAEYIRDGTIWNRVDTNVARYLAMQKDLPRLDININTSISAYSVLVIDQTVEYLLRLRKSNRVRLDMLLVDDMLSPLALQGHLRDRAQESLARAIQLLQDINLGDDVVLIRNQLENLLSIIKDPTQRRDYDLFIKYTRDLDSARGQNFEKTFEISL